MAFDAFLAGGPGPGPAGLRAVSFHVEAPKHRWTATILFLMSFIGWIIQVRRENGQLGPGILL